MLYNYMLFSLPYSLHFCFKFSYLKRKFYSGHQWFLYSSDWMECSNGTYKADHLYVLFRGRIGFCEEDVLWRTSMIIVFKQVNGILQWHIQGRPLQYYIEMQKMIYWSEEIIEQYINWRGCSLRYTWKLIKVK